MTAATVQDPYEAVLADLRAKRDQIDDVIRTLESFRAGVQGVTPPIESREIEEPNAENFLGMSIPNAARKLLAFRKRAMSNAEIADALQRGGLVMQSADPVNTVGSVLTRRFNQVGDVVRVRRGMWGLKEWYPNQSFKPPARPQNGTGAIDFPTVETSAPEQPSEPTDVDPPELD